jgi:hypothetical protein
VVRIFGFNDATEEADGWSQQPDVTHNAWQDQSRWSPWVVMHTPEPWRIWVVERKARKCVRRWDMGDFITFWTFVYGVLKASNKKKSQALVVHTCNPSYSGGRDQEDHGSKPAQGKYLVRPYLENT